ncbi:zinc finger and BTB domain-containing protein 14-like isoform X2 [Cloeon dipterum]|uniref:zinc finger and BTB domain-containing protein 14-like isoform X2 n=1 Tax=Cloeon dipterum TaxID=197152 RepID=UPI00322069CD
MDECTFKSFHDSSTVLCEGIKTRIVDEIGHLLHDEKFVDVTILCDRHVFRAHKVILCLASPLLRELLENNPSPDPVISFSDGVEWTHITWILQYVYSGQVSVPEKHFKEFLKTARLLHISSLYNLKGPELNSPSVKRPSTPEKEPPVPPAKKLRINKKVPKRKGNLVPRNIGEEIPIIISTKSLERESCLLTSDLTPSQQIIINAEPVSPEILKEGVYSDPNQEVITIQTGHVDDMPVEEIVEVMTSSGSDNANVLEASDSFTPEVIVSESPENQFKYLYAPSKAHLNPTHSLAPKKCNTCGKVYSNLSNLRQHVNLVHTKHSGVRCSLCPRGFKLELYLRRHLLTVHNIKPVKKESTTKESRRLMSLKASPLQLCVEDEYEPDQKLISEDDSAVENIDQHGPLS